MSPTEEDLLWNFDPFPVEIFYKSTYRQLLLLQMSLRLSVFNNFVVQLNIFIETDSFCEFMDVFADASSVEKKKSVSRSGGAAIVWEVVVAGSCVLFRSLDLPLSQALHHPGYVTAALIPTEKKY